VELFHHSLWNISTSLCGTFPPVSVEHFHQSLWNFFTSLCGTGQSVSWEQIPSRLCGKLIYQPTWNCLAIFWNCSTNLYVTEPPASVELY
jgi:hypothetical protein